MISISSLFCQCTVPDRSNLTGNALPERKKERLGNAKGTLRERKRKGTLKERKGNAKRTQEIKRSIFRGTRSWECVLEVHKIQWNTAKDDA